MIKKTYEQIQLQHRFFIFIGICLLARLYFAATMRLIDDEAYHWSWTQDLMLSYFDHPGFVAWVEWLSTAIFGHNYFGIRFPGFIAYVGTLLLAYRFCDRLFGRSAAQFVSLMLLFNPMWGLAGHVASPEPYLMLFWLWAAYIFARIYVFHDLDFRKGWLILGVLMGLGLNSKFIIALLAPGFGLYLLFDQKARKHLFTIWPWLGFLIASLICLPIFIWNIQYDWPGFKFQFRDRHQGESFSSQRWFVWLAAQALLMSPVLYFMQVKAFVGTFQFYKNERLKLLFFLTLPSILIFTVQPFFADYKPHWSGPALLLLTFLAGFQLSKSQFKKLWILGLLIFIVPLNLIFYSSLSTPWVPKAYRLFKPAETWQTTWDFSNEFYGWEELGEQLNRRQRQIHAQEGRRPFLAALRYETTAQAFWGSKQPLLHLSQARSHYTVMQDARKSLEQRKGQDALVVTTEKYPGDPIGWAHFSSCTPEEFKTYRVSELSRVFTIWWCRDFQGLK